MPRLHPCDPPRDHPTTLGGRSNARVVLAALDNAPVWLDSEPLTASVRGRAVLVDFWMYWCVNWLRTLPYVRAWAERYRDRGLVVVGAHVPEFGFEHDLDNVRRATRELDVGYPVVIDNDFAIWRAFDNHYWPAVYLVDGDGRVRFQHFGEEAYEETERAIQQLLGRRRGARARRRRRPRRARRLGQPGIARDLRGRPARRAPHRRAAPPPWRSTNGRSAATDRRRRGRRARDGRRVDRLPLREPRPQPRPRAAGCWWRRVRCAALLDGQPPRDDHGLDLDEAGEGAVDEGRLYQLVRQRGPIRGADLRDHVPRARRARLRLHIRLDEFLRTLFCREANVNVGWVGKWVHPRGRRSLAR